MTVHKNRAEPFVSELSNIEFLRKGGCSRNDDSIRLIAALRSRNLLTESRINSAVFEERLGVSLRSPKNEYVTRADGPIVIDPDADPRNADWIKDSCFVDHVTD